MRLILIFAICCVLTGIGFSIHWHYQYRPSNVKASKAIVIPKLPKAKTLSSKSVSASQIKKATEDNVFNQERGSGLLDGDDMVSAILRDQDLRTVATVNIFLRGICILNGVKYAQIIVADMPDEKNNNRNKSENASKTPNANDSEKVQLLPKSRFYKEQDVLENGWKVDSIEEDKVVLTLDKRRQELKMSYEWLELAKKMSNFKLDEPSMIVLGTSSAGTKSGQVNRNVNVQNASNRQNARTTNATNRTQNNVTANATNRTQNNVTANAGNRNNRSTTSNSSSNARSSNNRSR